MVDARPSAESDLCSDHAQCPAGSLCEFTTGECRAACDAECGACPSGEVCNPCGTSSCPGCRDCRPVCLPIPEGSSLCDDHGDCGDDGLCVFGFGGEENVCRPTCESIRCTDAQFCQSGATTTERCGMVLLDACSP